MKLLSVLSVTGEAYCFVWHERHLLWRLALPGLIVLVLADAAGLALPFGRGLLWGIAKLILYAGIVILYSVAWHRAYLIPGEPIHPKSAYRWQQRQTKFLMNYVKTTLVVVPIFLIGSFVAGLLATPFAGGGGGTRISTFAVVWLIGTQMAVWIVVGAISARLSLLFPATAADEHMDLGTGWSLTYGNGLRLLGIIILSAVPFWIAYLPVQLATYAGISLVGLRSSLTANLLLAILEQGLGLVAVAIGVSALSIAYRRIRVPPVDAAPATTPP
jgi:hypothetical protein